MQVVLVYLEPLRRKLLLKCVLQPKIAKKSLKTLRGWSLILMSIKREYGTSYAISHTVSEIQQLTCSKWLIFCTPPRSGWLLLNFGKSFTDPKTRVFVAVHGENFVILACVVWTQYQSADEQMDRQTPRQWLRCAKHYVLSHVKTNMLKYPCITTNINLISTYINKTLIIRIQ